MPTAMKAAIMHDGKVTTLDSLDRAGLLTFTAGTHTGPKRNGERKEVRHYRAELKDGSGFWDISPAAYYCRTGQKFKPESKPVPPKHSFSVAKDTGTPWLSGGR